MFGYLFICLLIIPYVLGEATCEYNWFQCKDSTKPLDCNEVTNPGWIKNSKVCDGAKDCSDGSDEYITLCKLHPSSPGIIPNLFYCASGGVIAESQICDDKIDCWDHSDELDCNSTSTDELSKTQRGNCSESEWNCLDNECIPSNKQCDDKIDCSNGLDESLEQCFERCESEDFQCGNGACIQNDLVCDNRVDCVDGADELPNVCDGIKNYTTLIYQPCSEPTNVKLLQFNQRTKYHVVNNTKYIWPNEPALFECPHYAKLVGKKWNVCQLNGKWHHDLPRCDRPTPLSVKKTTINKNRK